LTSINIISSFLCWQKWAYISQPQYCKCFSDCLRIMRVIAWLQFSYYCSKSVINRTMDVILVKVLWYHNLLLCKKSKIFRKYIYVNDCSIRVFLLNGGFTHPSNRALVPIPPLPPDVHHWCWLLEMFISKISAPRVWYLPRDAE